MLDSRPFTIQLVLDAAAALLVAGLVQTEHLRSARSSTLFALFLIVYLLDGVEKWRLFYGINSSLRTYLINKAVALQLALQLALVALQDVPKKHLIIHDEFRQSLLDEDAMGAFGGLLDNVWGTLLSLGGRPAQASEPFRVELHPQIHYEQLMRYWQPQGSMDSKKSTSLLIACLKAWKWNLLRALAFRLAMTVLHCAHPFIVSRLAEIVSQRSSDSDNLNERCMLFAAVIFVFWATAFVEERFEHHLHGYVTRLRGGVTALQLHKLYLLTDEGALKVSTSSTIRSDIDTITTHMRQLVMIPITVIEVALGISLLSFFLNAPATTVCLPLILAALMNFVLGRYMLCRVQNWGDVTATRIATSVKVFRQLTPIKMLGLGPTACALLHKLRMSEANAVLAYELLDTIYWVGLVLGDSGVILVAYHVADHVGFFAGGMPVAKAFTLSSITETLNTACVTALRSTSELISLASCVSRVEQFLNGDERKDGRLISCSSSSVSPSTTDAGDLIRFVHVDLAPSGLNKPVLRRVNFALARGSITGVVGPTRAGKSLLLQAILGRCERLAGSLHVHDTEIGYCGENVWLSNNTIRHNIIGHLPYNAALYRRVLRSCFLEEDIRWLPGGDEFVVGMGGSNLTDGQRQRIGIARAAYSQHEIILLDDVFRSLDSETAVCILHQLCGRNSLLRQAGCTVLVVTSLPQCMDVVDQLLFLEGLGSVTLDRTYLQPPNARRVTAALITLNTLSGHTSHVTEKRHLRSMRRYLESGNAPDTNSALSEQHDGGWQLFSFAISSISWTTAIFEVAALSALPLAEQLGHLFLQVWAALYPGDPTFVYSHTITNVCLLMVVPAARYAHYGIIAPRVWLYFHNLLVQTATQSKLASYERTSLAHFAKMYGDDTITMTRDLPRALTHLFYGGVWSAFAICSIVFSAEYMLVFLFGITIAALSLVRTFLTDSERTQKRATETIAAFDAHFEDTALGLANIYASQRQEIDLEIGMAALAASLQPFYADLLVSNRLRLGENLLTASIICAFTASALFIRGSSSETSVANIYVQCLVMPRALDIAVQAFRRIYLSSGAFQRLQDFAKTASVDAVDSEAEVPRGWPFAGAIELENVRAYYTPSAMATPTLLELSISVQPGEHIGIAGHSGSGKSALLLTLLGFIRYHGRITVDGIEISSVPPAKLRSHFITITEEPIIFDGTVRMNLLPLSMNSSGPVTDTQRDLELEQLLKRLFLWLPLATKGGLDARINDVGYSKADNQLICIARAIVRQRETGTKVILIDDATSCLSVEREKLANDIMREYFRGCTVLRSSMRESGLEGTTAVVHLRRGVAVDSDDIDAESESEIEEEEEEEEEG